MSLEKIGFYTLSNERAQNMSLTSPLWRCELLLTDRCNFKCPYCRGPNDYTKGTLTYAQAKKIVGLWIDGHLKNIRFSGGEPTLLSWLPDLVRYAKNSGIERVAVSTNGAAGQDRYQRLLDAGVDDFSISLDACCSSTGDTMAGEIKGAWAKVIKNIEFLAHRTYVTVGVVLTDTNFAELPKTIMLADSLGVSDIRIISAAQWNNEEKFRTLFEREETLKKYPILNYRVANFKAGKNVRGIGADDSHSCSLMLDDMVVAGNYHFSCVIAMREGAAPIGTIDDKSIAEIRAERAAYIETHDTHLSNICRTNCLDVCVEYNNTCKILQSKRLAT